MNRKITVFLAILMTIAFLTGASTLPASSVKNEIAKKTVTHKAKKAVKPFTGTININKASKKELMQLPGIGEEKADAILKARKKGKFKNSDDLLEINGIGKKTLKRLKRHLIF
jgi:competence ComEA-like helix-hairpin-helix protein